MNLKILKVVPQIVKSAIMMAFVQTNTMVIAQIVWKQNGQPTQNLCTLACYKTEMCVETQFVNYLKTTQIALKTVLALEMELVITANAQTKNITLHVLEIASIQIVEMVFVVMLKTP
jgi:hypothetical protein